MLDAYDFTLRWGYSGLFFASIIDSEPVVICISFLCRKLEFNILYIFFLSLSGTFCGGLLLFLVGRFFKDYLQSYLFIEKSLERVNSLVKCYGSYFIIGFRFVYGIKLVSPIVLGFSNIPLKVFILNNLIGSIAWSFIMVLLGVIMSWFIKTFSLQVVFYVYIFVVILPFIFISFYSFIKKKLN